ncbi:hypothetical protein HPB51_018013 [Rhipicephalus microplus]|uniref:Tick transposon n=1 Tax=Rhipicephalus microplus TaxID=6941 RepID=A0A9J6D624_RHIMP|nr:hypothetical protein HPB51_018013 [Rhipicephalus microplus]
MDAIVADLFQSAEDIREALSSPALSEMARRRPSELGLQSFVAAQKPFLSNSQLQERLMFATAMKDWTTEKWGNDIFSGESTFSTRWDQRKRVWHPLNCRWEAAIRSSSLADQLWDVHQAHEAAEELGISVPT